MEMRTLRYAFFFFGTIVISGATFVSLLLLGFVEGGLANLTSWRANDYPWHVQAEKEKPKAKRAKPTAAATKGAKGNAAKSNAAAKGKKAAKKVAEEDDSDELDNGAASGMNEDGVAI